MKTAIELLLSDARGIYIPRDFVQSFNMDQWNVSKEDQSILSNPDHEWYWEAWNDVLNSAECEIDGNVYTLHQDGDLWAICFELMTDKEKENFGFELD